MLLTSVSLFVRCKSSYCAIKSQHLRKLVSIHALSFADDHFGTNPLVNHPDYRSYAIATLKHVRSSDLTVHRHIP